MAKNNRMERVSIGFSQYISDMQSKLKQDTGKSFSRSDITAIIAAQKPVIKVEPRKKGSVFDF